MSPRVRLSLAVGVLFVSGAALFLRTANPTFADAKANEAKLPDWADAELPVKAGLELWLDATRLPAAHKAATKNDLSHDAKLETWYDASGHNRHVVQKDVEGRPQFVALPNGYKAVRFDGVQQALALAGLDRGYRELTVFIVAAPFSNRGDFRALLAVNQTNKNDYASGATIDFGPESSPKFQILNVEGAGFGSAVNLLKDASNFGATRRLCVTSAVGAGGVKLFVDGKAQGQRDRTDSTLRMDQITVGARFYNNGGLPNRRGFLDGDIAEVLLFDRVLSDKERGQVEAYLDTKYDKFRQVEAPKRTVVGKPLVAVVDPPAVQMFVPGFSVQPLPVDLTNINNLQYRPDGKLVALAYDGNVYLLSDTDNDGLEDKVELIWDNKGRIRAPIGMALTPPGYKHGDGLFVASKGKCSLLVDSEKTGKLDKEIVVADGWKEIPHGVDALGVAVDPKDHSIYFGLGTADYTNAYQNDKERKGQYRLDSERGTVLRVAPDLKSREIVATGIRFPVGIRFNAAGDLFCTDQEGATWLPNGNPFDELLHIEKSRHYGFPPRHPQHLPNVIDEPSVFDYGPQHQCTCGLNFNEPVNKGPIFGPEWWRSDVFVTGYSRGKLYRTKLVKTAGGYVAQNQLLVALTMLPVDACVSPTGDLVVAVHGGAPDWGNGPNGKGKLYKIRYTGKQLPQPVFAYAQGPREVRVAFDRPLEPQHMRELTGKIGIDYGKYVSAGDRFESQRPGYKVVVDQMATPRFDLPVLGVAVSQDRRALILQTAPHPEAVGYALTIPGLGRTTKTELKNEFAQRAETDLRYDLCGVDASWQGTQNGVWTGWLPHLDTVAARRFSTGSADHDDLWTRLGQPGKLTLRTKLNLTDMLRPAVQAGSQIGYEWPAEHVTLVFRSKADFVVKGPQGEVKTLEEEGFHVAALIVDPKRDEPISVEIAISTGGPFDLSVTYHTQEDSRPRALQLHRFLLPWAKLKPETTSVVQEVPELKGGNWAPGRRVFFSPEASCSKCHTFNGEGGKVGPDLSNLPQRDYHSVLRDIVEPSVAINPDYITQVVALKDGRVFTGVVRTAGETLAIGDASGNVTTVKRDQIDELTASPLSIMPEGLPKQLGPEKMRDLLTFLLTEPPHLTDYGKDAPPPAHTWKEVQAILAGAPEPPAKTRPLRVVLVAGKKDHGPGEHDYPAWLGVWKRLLGLAEDVAVSTANDWPSADDFQTADVVVFYQQGKWTPDRARDIDAYLARGGGLVYIHYAVDGGTDAPGFAQRIGLAWQGGQSKFRHGPLDLGFETGAKHPIGRNFTRVHFHDESYWQLIGDPKKIDLLASGAEEDKPQPLFWTLEPAKGRVFVSIPGHYSWTFDDPLFRILLLRGIAWTAREPVDRFNELVPVGANVKRE